ncbi:hypothetical protein [Streptomyces halobius]|nr:hypothetical protein [Streptomyces halobius]
MRPPKAERAPTTAGRPDAGFHTGAATVADAESRPGTGHRPIRT